MTVTTAAFILHRFAFQESDLILKVLTKNHGIISVIAKGARRSKTRTQGCFEPFILLELTYFGKSDLKKLKAIEIQSTNFQLEAERLYAAFYLNELLIHLVPISYSSSFLDSSGEMIFESYRDALNRLLDLGAEHFSMEVILREFEVKLLKSLGLWPDFSRDSLGNLLNEHDFYEVFVESSPRKIAPADLSRSSQAFGGALLLGLAAHDWHSPEVLMAAKKILRHWISHYCEGKIFKSRECFELLIESGRE
jgi:DNA repair protein RecO (recombination protein O)